MKTTEARPGRILICRLEDGDILHESIERAAQKHGITRALCFFVGGADSGSRLVVGPEQGRAATIVPMTTTLDNVFEAAGVGTVFPDEHGRPKLHMHAACGRGSDTRTGCVRAGVDVWLVGEVVVLEILDCTARRRLDSESGFELLETD